MNFKQFLKEAEEKKSEDLDKKQVEEDKDTNTDVTESDSDEVFNPLMNEIKNIVATINGDAKKLKIFPVKDLYILDYKSADEEVDTKEIIGYFLYKDTMDKQDDYYISKFVYNVQSKHIDVNIDTENREPIATIGDAEIKLNKLKTKKFTVGKEE